MNARLSSGIGALFVALLVVSAVYVLAVSAESIVTPLATENLGHIHADGEADSVWISGAGSVQVPAGWNTFTVNCQNENDDLGDGWVRMS
ncbi:MULTISPECIES: hypothetical protein [unclassified Methanoculleus]|jgi:hypothetical protein|uniref:Uncharacterized protein n=1 Tax=Methanoculleus palmolei TaxID=72612 RepID=A0ABD8A9Q7_9EURY|nr:hypothetical protein [Methanoculleus sp. UBA377]WOX56251.1 hypothetical protein R6Y95_02680 [Methanoculleus palmolei]